MAIKTHGLYKSTLKNSIPVSYKLDDDFFLKYQYVLAYLLTSDAAKLAFPKTACACMCYIRRYILKSEILLLITPSYYR